MLSDFADQVRALVDCAPTPVRNRSTKCVGERNYDQTADSAAMARLTLGRSATRLRCSMTRGIRSGLTPSFSNH